MTFKSTNYTFTIGLFGIGLDTYWPQFEGLERRLTGYLQQVAQRLERPRVRIVNLGLVDSPEKAEAAGHGFRQDDVDLIFLHVTTYALSSTVLPVVRRAKVPIVLLNLSPSAAIDYETFNRIQDRTKMTGEWLAYCQACPVPEIANVFRRCNIPFFQVTGTLEDSRAWNEINEWIDAGRVAHAMEHNRLGLMGHYYGGMLDIYSDLTQQCASFGGHIEMLEVDELAELRREVQPQEVARKVKEFRESFDVQSDCSLAELERAARTSAADAHYNLKEYSQACEKYDRATNRNPGNPLLQSKLGLAIVRKGNVERGLGLIRQAVESKPGAGELHDRLILSLVWLDRIEEGGEAAEAKLKMVEHPEAGDFLRAASLWARLKNWGRAAEALQAGLRLYPSDITLGRSLSEVTRTGIAPVYASAVQSRDSGG